ncbi:MAG: NAD-dependent epimerase/dehydratase family protein [Actinomycetes bacterium]
MKIFLTGATGFIGGEVARLAQARGDQVVALVRSPEKAMELKSRGVSIAQGDLDDTAAIERAMEGCDAAIHCAAVYEVGISKAEMEPMRRANVDGTVNVLEAARKAGVGKAVYVSTCATFGDTKGLIVDETFTHEGKGYTSCYEETKVLAQLEAERIGQAGLPLVTVLPGGVYGPADHSALGGVITKYAKRQLPAMLFPDLGLSVVHRDDVAAGILLALDKGRAGESYVLGGDIETLRGVVATEARILGRRFPRLTVPAGIIRALNPVGRIAGPALGAGPNLKEVADSADGVTFWASSDKAKAELGYSPRGLETGLRQTLEADGLLR